MPAHFALCVGPGYTTPDITVRRLLAASHDDEPARYTIATCRDGAIGVAVRTDRPSPGFAPLRRSPSGSVLAIAGVPTIANARSIDDALQRAVLGDPEQAVAILTSLDGAFFAAFHHAASATTILVSDFFGAMPVYDVTDHRGVAIATTIRAFTVSGVQPRRPSAAGWGGFVGAKYFVGHDTSVDGISQVEPATVRQLGAGRERRWRYWQWPACDARLSLEATDTHEVVAAIEESVDRYAALGIPSMLPLSGGFESRLLAGIVARRGHAATALTIANPYEHHEIEARLAGEVAAALGLPLIRYEAPPEFYDSIRFLDYVRASEVGNTSVNLLIAQLDAALAAHDVAASWDGVMFGLMMKDFSAPSRHQWAIAYLADDSLGWRGAAQVFAPRFISDMRDALRTTVDRQVADYDDSPEGETRFFNENRARRRAMANPLKVFGRHAWPLMPGLTRRAVDVLWRIPVREKTDARLYRRVLETHFPALARIPYCSHGELLPGNDVGPRYQWLRLRSRIVQHPRVGDWLRQIGYLPDDAAEPRIVDAAVHAAELDDPHLNADGIRQLAADGPTRQPLRATARELVFYWDAWQRIMRGERLPRPATVTAPLFLAQDDTDPALTFP